MPSQQDEAPADAQAIKQSLREAQILRGVIAGDTNKIIAQALGLQDATVNVHIRNIYRKLGAVSRSDAITITRKGSGVEAWLAPNDGAC